ncbi:hypothetical protein [Moorella sulfitireducens (nom. illeg.)]|nr:hypothetical protein [Moorella sulfitireducens]
MLLEEKGYIVDEAGNGEEALTHLKQKMGPGASVLLFIRITPAMEKVV